MDCDNWIEACEDEYMERWFEGPSVPELMPVARPDLNMSEMTSWSGTWVGALPRELQLLIREYWCDCDATAGYRFAGIMPRHMMPRQVWREMLPEWIEPGAKISRSVETCVGVPVRAECGDWCESAPTRDVVVQWGSRRIVIPDCIPGDLSGRTRLQFIDRWGSIRVCNRRNIRYIYGLPDDPRVVDYDDMDYVDVDTSRVSCHYLRSAGIIYKVLRDVIIGVAVGDGVWCHAVDGRGNFLKLGSSIRVERPAWVPYVAGAPPPTTEPTVTLHDIGDAGDWMMAPSGALYSGHKNFTRVYLPIS